MKKLLGACLHASKTTSTIADSSFTLTILSRGLRESSPEKKNRIKKHIYFGLIKLVSPEIFPQRCPPDVGPTEIKDALEGCPRRLPP